MYEFFKKMPALLTRPRTPFGMLSQLSFVFVAGSALHLPWPTAVVVGLFIIAAYLVSLLTMKSETRAS